MLEKSFAVPDLIQPALPPQVSWFPLPEGWLVSGAILAIILSLLIFFRIARWRRNLWRREAYALIQENMNVDSWLQLIKRILLIHLPRSVVSKDMAPVSFLRHVPVDDDLSILLNSKYCQRDNFLDDNQASRLRTQIMCWLEDLPDV
ncbi:TPA: DUF4381 domain-containing protein [Raoultella planticola]|nr:DUF4381 domain-containing protein [Raoultella planticola]HAT1648193.1 DUF4381 domain-containing protein [Raoultella planticola]